ncbi:MAG: PEFG-CTERM sorting domain-containing protein [Nitrososphaera sp.]|jgi:predicted secreted protein with PEFG-CTERM motif
MDYKAYALLGILLASVIAGGASSAAFAQTAITIKTDKDSYTAGETVMISGSVGTVSGGQTSAVIQVTNPLGAFSAYSPITVGSDGSYSYSMKTPASANKLFPTGQYTAIITYNGNQKSTTFTFTASTSNGGQSGGSGQWKTITVNLGGNPYTIKYQVTGATVTGVNGNPDTQTLNFTLNTQSAGMLTLQLPRNVIDSKKTDGSDDSFAAFVDDIDTPVTDNSSDSQTRTITIPFDQGAGTVEVVGTFMIPEFGTIAMVVLAVAIVGIVVATTRYSKLSFLPKF